MLYLSDSASRIRNFPSDASNVGEENLRDVLTPSRPSSLSESEALAFLKEILANAGDDDMISRLDMEAELPSGDGRQASAFLPRPSPLGRRTYKSQRPRAAVAHLDVRRRK